MTTTTERTEPEIVRQNIFSVQACVPEGWTDEQVLEFVEGGVPCGTRHGWHIDQVQGRVTCAERKGFIHIVLGI